MEKVLSTAPTEPGLYWLRCDENDQENETVNLSRDSKGEIMVDDESFFMSDCPVSIIHDGLINPSWVKVK